MELLVYDLYSPLLRLHGVDKFLKCPVPFVSYGATVAGNDTVVTIPRLHVFWCTENKGRYEILTLNTGGKPTENILNQQASCVNSNC